MKTFVDLIDAFGPGAVADAIGVTRNHVHTMRARNSIPPIYWGDLVVAAPSHGIPDLTLSKCRNLRADAFREKAAAPARPTPTPASEVAA